MEFHQLEAFLEAANRESFRRAADALYLSQPSISARGVRLTDMGRTFFPLPSGPWKRCVAGKRF